MNQARRPSSNPAATIAQIALDQKVEGSNPSSPATINPRLNCELKWVSSISSTPGKLGCSNGKHALVNDSREPVRRRPVVRLA